MTVENPEAEVFITPEQRTTIAEAARRLGVVEAAKRLGISSETMLRIAGGFGSQSGSEALAASRIDRLA